MFENLHSDFLKICVFILFFFVTPAACKIPGQGLNPRHRSNNRILNLHSHKGTPILPFLSLHSLGSTPSFFKTFHIPFFIVSCPQFYYGLMGVTFTSLSLNNMFIFLLYVYVYSSFSLILEVTSWWEFSFSHIFWPPSVFTRIPHPSLFKLELSCYFGQIKVQFLYNTMT